jgi:hypothetical protein
VLKPSELPDAAAQTAAEKAAQASPMQAGD